MSPDHLERSHRLGPKVTKDGKTSRDRVIIVRFRSEKLRDAVYRSRFKLKYHNSEHPQNKIFISEDLTAKTCCVGPGDEIAEERGKTYRLLDGQRQHPRQGSQ